MVLLLYLIYYIIVLTAFSELERESDFNKEGPAKFFSDLF